MSQSSYADAAPPGAVPARRGAGPALALRNWPVARRLIALVAIPTVLGLALTGLRVTDAMRGAAAYGQVGRLAMLGQQVTGLAQAMEDERAGTAAFIADGRPAAGLVALHRQYVITDGRAATVRRRIAQLGHGYPAQTRAGEATALVRIAELPGLRRQAAQSDAPALAVINGYSAATAGLFPLDDSIADLSDNAALITSVRALGLLSRMKDQASQQQALLGAALAAGHFEPGALTALTNAQAQQASDLVSFRSSATHEESSALTGTLAGPPAVQALAVEQRATATGDGALALGAGASQQWQAGMSYTVGWMRHAEQQLAVWITAYAQAMQRSTMRSAAITGGTALAVLILVLLATMIIVRSVVRPLRRLETAALDVAGVGLPAEIRSLGGAGKSGHPLPMTPIDVLSTDEIGHLALAFDRVQRQAVRLAREDARLRGSVSAIFASFFRRSHSLLERLLRLIDSLELTEDDPERLASLFQMDHLATRMRRNSDSALVLTGHQTPRRWTEPVTLVDALRAAVSEIEQYDRVSLNVQPGFSVNGSAAADTVHLLAELLENATSFSPRTTQVVVSGHLVRGGGSVINIADGGTGMPPEQLRQLNGQLARPALADMALARHMGLFAVAHLAARHGIGVALRPRPGGGTSAEVHLPAALILPDAEPGGRPGQTGEVHRARGGRGAGAAATAAAADPRGSASPFAAGPQAAAERQFAMPGAAAMPLSAPLPATGQAASAVIVPEPADPEPGGMLPIFESVESDYFRARSRGLLRRTAAGDIPAAGGLTSAGLPQRIPQTSFAPGAAIDPETQQATAAESAQIAVGWLASFQRGSRRARAMPRIDRDTDQSAQDD